MNTIANQPHDDERLPTKISAFLDLNVKVRWVLPAYLLVVIVAFLVLLVQQSAGEGVLQAQRNDIAFLAYQDAITKYTVCTNQVSEHEAVRGLAFGLSVLLDDPADRERFVRIVNETYPSLSETDCGPIPISPLVDVEG